MVDFLPHARGERPHVGLWAGTHVLQSTQRLQCHMARSFQALEGKDITVYGDGKQTRSFQYVSDLVAGLYKLMNSENNLPTNLGNPVETTINDFAKYIRKHVNEDVQVMPPQCPDLLPVACLPIPLCIRRCDLGLEPVACLPPHHASLWHLRYPPPPPGSRSLFSNTAAQAPAAYIECRGPSHRHRIGTATGPAVAMGDSPGVLMGDSQAQHPR